MLASLAWGGHTRPAMGDLAGAKLARTGDHDPVHGLVLGTDHRRAGSIHLVDVLQPNPLVRSHSWTARDRRHRSHYVVPERPDHAAPSDAHAVDYERSADRYHRLRRLV